MREEIGTTVGIKRRILFVRGMIRQGSSKHCQPSSGEEILRPTSYPYIQHFKPQIKENISDDIALDF